MCARAYYACGMSWRDLRSAIAIPVVQAPMAGVSSAAMAAAISHAGGLGSIGVGATSADGAREMIRQVRARTDRAFNVNVFCHRPARRDEAIERAWIARLSPELMRHGATPPSELHEIYRSFRQDDAMLAMLVAERPAVVSFHFGVPASDRIEALRAAGIVLFGTATSVAEARVMAHAGCDVVVAQGWEAGGHRGVLDPDAADERLATRALTKAIATALDVPVIAAGGLMDGADVAEVIALGATCAQLGTVFVGCDESLADEGYRAALFDGSHETVMTRAISGRPARCLVNRFTAIGAHVDPKEIPSYPVAYDLGKALHAAARAHGEHGFGAQWAGTGAARARRGSAAAIVRAIGGGIR
jgi:nitronate monooxygenase